jgi:hypothetical protein
MSRTKLGAPGQRDAELGALAATRGWSDAPFLSQQLIPPLHPKSGRKDKAWIGRDGPRTGIHRLAIEMRRRNARAISNGGGGSYLFLFNALSFLWTSFCQIGSLQLIAI